MNASRVLSPTSSKSRSEERRVGKSVDHCVTGVQTCALPIYKVDRVNQLAPVSFVNFVAEQRDECVKGIVSDVFKIQIGRASCGKECRSLCDWSSDVCSSDLQS